jgi:type I restriction enzyme S subunit
MVNPNAAGIVEMGYGATELLVPSGYKQTEAGVIPEDWGVVSAVEACSKIQDGTHFSPRGRGHDYLYVTSKNVRFGHLDLSTAGWIDAAQHQAIYRRCDVKEGDLLLTKDGANTGNAALNTLAQEFSLLSSVAFLRFNPRRYCAAYFLQQILTSQVQRQIHDAMAGNAITRLTLEKISKLHFPVPPTKTEQVVIAEALCDADALIESLKQLIAKKRQIKQGAMQELLTGKKRLPGFHGEWEEKPFNQVCWFQEGPGVRNTQFTASGIKLLNGTNIVRGVLNLNSTSRFISETEAHGAYAHFLADAGDIVIASSGITIEQFQEKVAFVREHNLPICMNTSTIRFKPFTGILASAFLFQFLTSFLFKRAIGGQATGSAQLNFGPSHVAKVYVSLPPYPEQTAIAAVLSDMDEEIAAMEAKLVKARQIKQGMMQELLTGKVRLV